MSTADRSRYPWLFSYRDCPTVDGHDDEAAMNGAACCARDRPWPLLPNLIPAAAAAVIAGSGACAIEPMRHVHSQRNYLRG